MSLLLDQALVEDVAKYCPAQFLEYHKCLGGGDASKCLEQQDKLAKCVKTDVPSFVKILNECGDKLKAYENCIRDNMSMRSKCFDLLQEVRQCSAKSINAKASLDK
uniref:ARAD1D24398p n=1 Tax=Blastobotrys adeninivorans TaxID=409370 RepID=A0A060TB15_BLAAD